MGKNFEKSNDSSVHWETPKWLYKILNKYFHFNDDPCPIDGEKGLFRDWGNRTFVNPPYGRVRGKLIQADTKPSSLLTEAITGTEKLIKMIKEMGVK